jgi:lysophospholipase L1-like esterase
MTRAPSERRVRLGLGARITLLAISMLIGLLVLEGGVRLRQYLKYGTTSAAALELVTDPATGLRIAKPGLNTGRIQVNSHGFRSPELQTPKPESRIRLAFLGGSTTFCSEVSSNEATWPYRVVQALAARYPDAEFDFVNGAQVGYGTASLLQTLRQRVAPLQPDVILCYEATNDFSKDTREVAQREGLYEGEADRPSALAHVSSAWALVEKNLAIRRRSAANGPRLVYNADSLARPFESRLVELLREGQRTAPLTAIATFSHKVRRDQPAEAQRQASLSSLYYMPYMSIPGLLDGWDAYNQAIRAAARETGSILIEGDETIPGDDAHFADSVHFLDPGSAKMADRVARALIASPEFNRLIESKRTER